MKAKEYYYNFNITCDIYLYGGIVHEDVEAYAKSKEDLEKIVNKEIIYEYMNKEDVKEYKSLYGDFGVSINYTTDKRLPEYDFDEDEEEEE